MSVARRLHRRHGCRQPSRGAADGQDVRRRVRRGGVIFGGAGGLVVIAPVAPAPRAPGALALSTYELTKRFGGFTALDAVSIDVAAGSVHALLGENGAGKSTLVKCVAGYHPPESGSILID